jgi:glycosyltransferase involved in cell wall biosynthesis
MGEFSADLFKFDAQQLDAPRLPGISAIMRIKNGEEFLRVSIESHLPFVDEIVACYNDCSDATVEILQELATQYPGKIRPIEYTPKVFPILSPEHAKTPTESVNSIANYYNFALSAVKFSYAMKLDDDHLAIDKNFEYAIKEVRDAISKYEKKLFTFSGLNLAPNQMGHLEVFLPEIFVGSGDHLFFPVCKEIYFVQNARTEVFKFPRPRLPKIYVGLLYFHLKYCKSSCGFANLDSRSQEAAHATHARNFETIPFGKFCNSEFVKRLIRKINGLEYWMGTNKISRRLIHRLTGRNPPLKIARLHQLSGDLAKVNFQKDVIDRLLINKLPNKILRQ